MNLPRLLLVLVLVPELAFAVPAFAAAGEGAPDRHVREASELVQQAQAHLARRTVDGRRAAIDDLERATALEPGDAGVQLLLARTYFAARWTRAAMQRFELVASLAPSDPEARYGLGCVWRRDWLKYLEPASLVRAIAHFEATTRLDSSRVDAWLMLASLRAESRDSLGARQAAERAWRLAPGRGEVLIALGAMRWRTGDAEGADSAFRAALPRLGRRVRERFDDIAPLVAEQDTAIFNHLPPQEQADWARRFWVKNDPDLATFENEAQLEYWARVAQAYFLWYDPRHEEWDERGEIYVRYGPPDRAVYNPVGTLLSSRLNDLTRFRFPMNVLVWEYPRLGMSVTLQDRVLSSYYLLPRSSEADTDPRPDPDSLARREGVATTSGRGLFPPRPPGISRLPAAAVVAAFAGGARGRLFAAIEAPAAPGDSLWAEMVVLDSAAHVAARSSGSPSPSACAPDRYRVADFAAALPAGDYLVGLTVHGRAARGSIRLPLTIASQDSVLALSDLVVTCGPPDIGGPGVRLAANPTATVGPGAPLTAYFEIENLALGPDGQSHFEYDWRVRSAAKDPRIWIQRALQPRRGVPEIEATRLEDSPGSLRRQFVSVPVQNLPPGRYRLEVTVRDRVSGNEAKGVALFEHTVAARP